MSTSSLVRFLPRLLSARGKRHGVRVQRWHLLPKLCSPGSHTQPTVPSVASPDRRIQRFGGLESRGSFIRILIQGHRLTGERTRPRTRDKKEERQVCESMWQDHQGREGTGPEHLAQALTLETVSTACGSRNTNVWSGLRSREQPG